MIRAAFALALVGCTQPAVTLPAPAVTLGAPEVALPVVAPKLVLPSTGIPQDALRWKADLRRAAQFEWGLDAPVGTMGAQIHQESAWRADAVSPVGATGLSQFMPATATWLSGVDATIGPADPKNPIWAMRALASYDYILWQEVQKQRSTPIADGCSRAAMMLSAYNGGVKWVDRDRKQALAQGLRDDIWWGNVEKVNAGRTVAAWTENKTYARKVLLVFEPRYIAAGFGAGMCQ